jgi:hypothetical protein
MIEILPPLPHQDKEAYPTGYAVPARQPKTDAQIDAEAKELQAKRIANIQKRIMKEQGDLTLSAYWKKKARDQGKTVEQLLEERKNGIVS